MSPRQAVVVEDLEWLLRHGENPDRAAHRLGYASARVLVRVLRRWGRYDLAGRVEAA